ncbi:MAG: tetratricopeptide repeat protein [Planctomycetota bacterium]
MAKKRLNKKVALVGSVVFVLLVLGAIVAVLYLNRSPDRFIKDGDAAIKMAREAADEQKKAEEYKRAESSYGQANRLARTDSERVGVLFKLSDVYMETDQWPNVLKCWNGIVRIDAQDIRARFGRLKYLYIMADSGFHGAWNEIVSQASQLIDVAEEANLLTEKIVRWDPFMEVESEAGEEKLGPYLYLLRGRANLEIARFGASADPEALLIQTMDDLKKVQEFQPGNVAAYEYMALSALARGEILASRGDFGARDRAAVEAQDYLEQAVEVAGDNARPQVMLLSMKLSSAQKSEPGVIEEQVFSLEPAYVSLVEKYPSSPEAFLASAGFYQLRLQSLDKAIEAGERAVELDKDNVDCWRRAAGLYYSKHCIYGEKLYLDKAIEFVAKALELPDAQDKPGPRQWANRTNRALLFAFLAECYIEQILEGKGLVTESQIEARFAEAEEAVNEVKQLFGTGEEPQVLKWEGMLELARGNTKNATRLMYNAYEQLKSVDKKDSLLSYRLAKIFEKTAEIGAAKEFFVSGLRRPNRIDEKKPEALLDYAELLLRVGSYNEALSVADFFEGKYWASERSRRNRMNAYIGAGQFKEVEEDLSKSAPTDPNTMKLHLALLRAKIRQDQKAIAWERMKESTPDALQELEAPGEVAVEPDVSIEVMTDELKAYWGEFAELLEKLLAVEPNSVGASSIVAVCNNYVAGGKVGDAQKLADKYLERFPDSTAVGFYRALLSEPEPGKISQERRRQIEEGVLLRIADPFRRAIELGKHYRRHAELEKATAEFRKVVDLDVLAVDEAGGEDAELTEYERLAASYLFEIALAQKDWELAEKIEAVARSKDMDQCEGSFFAARHAMSRAAATDAPASRSELYTTALADINRCLKQRAVFSHGFLIRSNISAALGDEHMAIADAEKAVSLNLLDGNISKNLGFVLYKRDQRLGENVTSDQTIETKNALVRALRTNPGDLQLLSFYAEYISRTEPAKALAIRQHLQKAVPSLQNALRLGMLALKMAGDETNADARALLEIARASFDEAIAVAPDDRTALEAKAQYFRFMGEPGKARELLEQAGADELLWAHYVKLSRFEDAKHVLDRLYERDPRDSRVIRGLLMVAEQTGDREGVKRYCEALLSVAEGVENRLLQIETFLRIGLVEDAENNLERFKEKYPGEPRALLLEAWLAMRRGQLERALELTNRNLQTDQENDLAWGIRGRINLLMANYDQAVDDLQKSKSLSNEPVTSYYLARAYLRSGRVEDAITELKSSIDLPEGLGQGAPVGRSPMELLEQIYLRHGRKAALSRFYDEMLSRFPDDVTWYNRAGALAIGEKDFDRAGQLYKQAMEVANSKKEAGKSDVDKDQFLVSLDGYLQSLVLGAGSPSTPGRWKPEQLNKVFEEGRKYVDSGFAPIVYFRMGEAKMKLGDKGAAAEYCRAGLAKAFASGTDESMASAIVRRMYSLLGAEEVLKYWEQRLSSEPDSLAANLGMFNVMKIRGEYNKALEYIDKCLEIVGPEDGRRQGYVLSKVDVLSLAYGKTSDNSYLKSAIGEYESLLAEMPNNTVVLNNLAYLLAESGERLPGALEYAARAYKLRPNSAGLLDTYAYVLYKNGRYSEADEILQSALQLYGQDGATAPAVVYEHLGMVKEALGARAEALAAYERALEGGAGESSDSVRERIVSAIKRISGQEGAGN